MYIDDDCPTVIDLGAGGRAFSELPCNDIKLALISHFHFDHLHGDSFFPHAKLWAGQEERESYNNPEQYLAFHGYDLWEQIMPGVERAAYGQVVPLPDDVPVKPGFRPIPLAGTFNDNMEINLGSRNITAIHLPGHTAGHYGFYLKDEGVLFSGDIDLVESGPWYSSASGDVGQLINSVRKIQEIDPVIIVPSHRRVQTDNIQKQLQIYIQVVLDRDSRIYDILKIPHTLSQLGDYKLVFPQANNIYEVFWERMTVFNHLKHLLRHNLIAEVEPGLYQQI
jgi:glyoxylase-like metal-dependent hydrolase (beta-lactamase superfamily II)